MDEPRDPQPERQTTHTGEAEPEPCRCGSLEHQAIRIGERLSAAGVGIGPVYVCPGESANGLQGAL
ncbi:hypothetical protein [Streptomyces chartreusis]|uniref:hypothetical protein n=1 Tax=Streptomyces chartreusis TaxID=1969 RepID=UPI00123D1B66|nr:hypothetical protein [Streptomyces chartreusis]QEV66179.1 hypothetical protein CP983_05565 [Streptomyces chartreusis]GGW98460.1 hypothetical protein GCM10010321_10980 [Streptomyces chartreusis]